MSIIKIRRRTENGEGYWQITIRAEADADTIEVDGQKWIVGQVAGTRGGQFRRYHPARRNASSWVLLFCKTDGQPKFCSAKIMRSLQWDVYSPRSLESD